jgi:nitrite reductase/ring-hydroxylating ferredoxin subunit
MLTTNAQQVAKKQGAEDAGRYFKYMAEFVGFTQAEAEAIRESRFIIEKYIPEIVSKFYAHLLRYPPTRKYFLKKDGSVNQEYLQLRMQHLANFWRRTAGGVYDDEYARYVDYVGRAHTSHGADPHIYIPERYVIGQVGLMQHAISEAITKELHDIDPEWELRALKAWNLLMMVILELLSRAYGHEREPETYSPRATIDHEAVFQLAVESYEVGLGMRTSMEPKDVMVGRAEDIPDGERKLVQVDDLSIGVFHHQGAWYAVRNSCLHRGGPVAAGSLEGDVLTCPWHGYKYNVTNGELLADPKAKLDMYPVEVRDGELHLQIPVVWRDSIELSIVEEQEIAAEAAALKESEFRASQVGPGQTALVHLDGQPVAVYNVDGTFYATQEACTHADGPLSQGDLEGQVITCPWHGSCFDVTNGAVVCGPASEPLKTYRVVVSGEIGQVKDS